MEAVLKELTFILANATEGVAALLIGLAIVQATWRSLKSYFLDGFLSSESDLVRLQLGRWLVLALEFELAADILRTAVAPTWNEIAQLAAIVVLRTVLNFFLQKEISSAQQKNKA